MTKLQHEEFDELKRRIIQSEKKLKARNAYFLELKEETVRQQQQLEKQVEEVQNRLVQINNFLNGINDQQEELKGLKDELKALQVKVIQSEEEVKKYKEKCLTVEQLEKEIEMVQENRNGYSVPVNRSGKGLSLRSEEIEKILSLYFQGLSVKEIQQRMVHIKDKRQISRVINVEYKGKNSINQIRTVVNKLLQRNQSPMFIKKLYQFKEQHNLN